MTTTDLHNLAGQTLLRFSELVSELVLDPSVTLDDRDLATLKSTRETIIDLAFLGNGRQRSTRGSAHTQAEVVSRTQAFPGHGQSDATALLKRLDHHLDLLARMHGPQALDVRTEPCDKPHVDNLLASEVTRG